MADLNTLESPSFTPTTTHTSSSPSSSRSPSPSPSPSPAPLENDAPENPNPNQTTVSSPVPTTAAQKISEGWKKTDKAALLIGGVLLAQMIMFYQMIQPAIQITNETYQEYKNTVAEFNNQKHHDLEEKISKMEAENQELRRQVNILLQEKEAKPSGNH